MDALRDVWSEHRPEAQQAAAAYGSAYALLLIAEAAAEDLGAKRLELDQLLW